MQRDVHRMLFYPQNSVDSCLGTVLKIARKMASFSSGFFHIHPTWHWGAGCPARGERKIMTKSLILERKFGHYCAATESPIVSQSSRVNWFQWFRIVFLIRLKIFDVRESWKLGSRTWSTTWVFESGYYHRLLSLINLFVTIKYTRKIVTTPGGEVIKVQALSNKTGSPQRSV